MCHSNVQRFFCPNVWFKLNQIVYSEIYRVLFKTIHYWNYFQSRTSWLLAMNEWNEKAIWWIEHFIISYLICENCSFFFRILLMFWREMYLSATQLLSIWMEWWLLNSNFDRFLSFISCSISWKHSPCFLI